eukprot:107658-Chlamydomonas_euryale.AAC.14
MAARGQRRKQRIAAKGANSSARCAHAVVGACGLAHFRAAVSRHAAFEHANIHVPAGRDWRRQRREDPGPQHLPTLRMPWHGQAAVPLFKAFPRLTLLPHLSCHVALALSPCLLMLRFGMGDRAWACPSLDTRLRFARIAAFLTWELARGL